ncbi:hypothetical protein BWD42_20770 [Sphingobacterium sp. CZ-UAM]|uniref:hypothetical protein n=1 Tax=Sphingobacterium sp. CZ-UAM TaxID=1933868 RepID=UPI000986F410|nr:hypothetical protein [Sphingobacterium sp. CZ-UAM]OOG16181.1 hypothetical protein BWD42_20770 [Sphingobacterium sp. CZ-UAM]
MRSGAKIGSFYNHFQDFCSYFFCFSANWLERWGIVFPSRGSSGAREASVGADSGEGSTGKDRWWVSTGSAAGLETALRRKGSGSGDGTGNTVRAGIPGTAKGLSPGPLAQWRTEGRLVRPFSVLSVPASPSLRLPPIVYLSFPYPFPII